MNIVLLMMSFKQDKFEANTIIAKSFSESLIESGHSVSIICPQLSGYKEHEIHNGIKIYRLNKKGRIYNEVGLFKDGIDIAKKSQGITHFEVIINVFASPIVAYRTKHLLKSERKSKFVAMVRSISSKSDYSLGSRSYLWSFLMKHYDLIITPLESIRDRLVKMGVSAKKIVILRSPINLSKFVSKDKVELRKKYGYEGRKVILYYGHFKKVKGITYLLDAVRHMKTKKVQILLVHSRDRVHDAYDNVIAKRVRMLKGKAKILPYTVNIVDYINLADCVCFPYPELVSTEGNPSCLLESMACKTPVVTTDLPELREIVRHQVDVLMAKPKDSVSLAAQIDLLLSDDSLVRELVKNAYEKSREFDSLDINKKFVALIEKLKS